MAVRPSISVHLSRINDLPSSTFKVFIYGFIGLLFPTTVCVRIVADFVSSIFQFTTNVIAYYNVHIYYYFGYYFYTLLWAFFLFIFVKNDCANEYYSPDYINYIP